MKEHEFLAKVRERGSYADQADAERVTRAVLGLFGERLTPGEAADLAAQLPGSLQGAVATDGQGGEGGEGGQGYGVEEFLRRVGDALGSSQETATWDASAVLSTVAEAVSGGQLNQILTRLPSGYAPLLGKPELA